MEKILISVTERQKNALKSEAESLGIPKSELIRRIMDRYLESGKKITKVEIVQDNEVKVALD